MYHPVISKAAPEVSITNRGIKLSTSLDYDEINGYFVLLPDYWHHSSQKSVMVLLRQVQAENYLRTWSNSLVLSLLADDTACNISIPKTLSPIQNQRLLSRSLELKLSPTSDFSKCVATPAGCYNPTRCLLVPDFEASSVSSLEFKPPWSDEYDTFVVVCHIFAQSEVWHVRLFPGDQWIYRRDRVRDVSFSERFALTSSLELKHLFKATISKKVTAELRQNNGKQPSLEVRIID